MHYPNINADSCELLLSPELARKAILKIELSYLRVLFVLMFGTIPPDAEAAADKEADGQKRPNILLILADDMGYGDLSCYGAESFKTPNIDRIAKDGILFTDAHSGGSSCTPTRYGLMTGRHSFRTWLKYSALSTNAPLLIEEGRMTLACMLNEKGYSTALVGKWHLGFGSEEGFADNRTGSPNSWETRGKGPNWNGILKPGPLERGFDHAFMIPVANSFPPYVLVENHRVVGLRDDSPIKKMESKNMGRMEGGEGARWKDEELADSLTAATVARLEGFAREKKPFFLFYSPHQPHVPHRPGARFKGSSKAGDYGDVIQELDWSVGEILQALYRLGLAENTLVLFSSDNGASITAVERSRLRRWEHNPNGILRGHKGTIAEGGHRIPFIARWPGKIKPGMRSDALLSLNDLMATFAAILGTELPPGAGPDSYNVLPELLGRPSRNPDRSVVFAAGTGALCIRVGKWKYFDGQTVDGVNPFLKTKPKLNPEMPPGQLYNLDEDIREANNLYDQHPEVVKTLKRKLEEIKNAEH